MKVGREDPCGYVIHRGDVSCPQWLHRLLTTKDTKDTKDEDAYSSDSGPLITR